MNQSQEVTFSFDGSVPFPLLLLYTFHSILVTGTATGYEFMSKVSLTSKIFFISKTRFALTIYDYASKGRNASLK